MGVFFFPLSSSFKKREKKLSPLIKIIYIRLHRARRSKTNLVQPEASITWTFGFVAYMQVFRHHHSGSDKSSGSIPEPFILQHPIHPHLKLISLLTSSFSSSLSGLFICCSGHSADVPTLTHIGYS